MTSISTQSSLYKFLAESATLDPRNSSSLLVSMRLLQIRTFSGLARLNIKLHLFFADFNIRIEVEQTKCIHCSRNFWLDNFWWLGTHFWKVEAALPDHYVKVVEAIHCPLRIGSSGFVFLSSFFCNNSCCYDSFDNCGSDDGGRCTFCSWDSSSYCWRLKPLPHRPRQATLGGVYHIESYCCFVHC